jgi:hypothetical protein
MIGNKDYLHFDETDSSLMNLNILLGNRSKSNIFILTTKEIHLVAAMYQRFCVVPVTSYQKFNEDDFVLKLVENYL